MSKERSDLAPGSAADVMASEGVTPAPQPTTRPGLRDRYRAQVRAEVKEAALQQLAAGGPAAVSLNAIAKQLGVSGPALYRYFAGRDELLTELAADTWQDLLDAAQAGGASDTSMPAADRLRALGHAYRGYAVRHPDRYRLLLAPRQGTFDVNDEAVMGIGHRLMSGVFELFGAVGGCGMPIGPDLAEQLRRWTSDREAESEVDPCVALAGLLTWSRLHGIVTLELGGVFQATGVDPALVIDAEVDALLDSFRTAAACDSP